MRATKPKFYKGQVVMWKRRDPLSGPYPVQVTWVHGMVKLPGGKTSWRYDVTNAHADSGWVEKNFRELTEKEKGNRKKGK